MGLTLTAFCITCAICYGIFRYAMWHFRRRRLYEFASQFEGPPPLPFIGNGHLLMGSNEHILNKIDEIGEAYPSPVRFWLGPVLGFGINNPEHIKAICLSPKTSGKGWLFADYCRPLIGEGLLAAPVAKWKVHRKLIQPTFNQRLLNSFVEVFTAQSKVLTDQMERNLDGPEFEIFKLISLCTLDMVCETAMGVKVEAQTNENCRYVEAITKVVTSINERLFRPWLHPDFIFSRTQLGQDQLKGIKYFHDFTSNVIQTRKIEQLKGSSQVDAAGNEDGGYNPIPRKEAFLDLFMKLTYENASLSDEALRDETQMMVIGGNESSTITDSFVFLMLASNPDAQEKVYQELYEIYGDADIEECPVTAKDLSRMKYLERVLKETMRLFPAAPLIVREVTEDLDIGDHRTLPSGSLAIIAILNLQRNEKYWPDSFKFNPDRFLPEEVAKRHPYSFMTFSGGPRNCIGQNYAMMAMKTMFATILRRYVLKKDEISPIKDIRLKMEIMLSPVDPIKIRIERRNRK